jgi:hypothetical protein
MGCWGQSMRRIADKLCVRDSGLITTHTTLLVQPLTAAEPTRDPYHSVLLSSEVCQREIRDLLLWIAKRPILSACI